MPKLSLFMELVHGDKRIRKHVPLDSISHGTKLSTLTKCPVLLEAAENPFIRVQHMCN
jgi:hypothetical protein